MNSERTS